MAQLVGGDVHRVDAALVEGQATAETVSTHHSRGELDPAIAPGGVAERGQATLETDVVDLDRQVRPRPARRFERHVEAGAVPGLRGRAHRPLVGLRHVRPVADHLSGVLLDPAVSLSRNHRRQHAVTVELDADRSRRVRGRVDSSGRSRCRSQRGRRAVGDGRGCRQQTAGQQDSCTPPQARPHCPASPVGHWSQQVRNAARYVVSLCRHSSVKNPRRPR